MRKAAQRPMVLLFLVYFLDKWAVINPITNENINERCYFALD